MKSPMPDSSRTEILHSVNRGEFWKPCPGTTAGYLCCGYQIITPLTGCGMYCAYCVLQAYFEHDHQVAYTNLDDLEHEIREKMSRWKGVVRFGTGEFGDSLFQEDRLGLSRRIAAMLEPYPNAIVEFKTKSANVRALSGIRYPQRVVVGFSMNTPRMIGMFERGTMSLDERLDAARWCVEQGYWVAFHFDPMIWYAEWEPEYRDVARRILETLPDPSRIAWWSMGGFRCMPALKKIVRGRNEHLPLFAGEMLLGEDRKLRYFRPQRTAFYRAVREEVEARAPEIPLYLCMESPEAWEDSGMKDRIPNGLAEYLDDRARGMLAAA